MAQFDVHALPDGTLVVDVQSDLFNTYDTRFVLPLLSPDEHVRETRRLNPRLVIGGESYVLATQLGTAIRVSTLSNRRGSLKDEDLTIKLAIYMLIAGY